MNNTHTEVQSILAKHSSPNRASSLKIKIYKEATETLGFDDCRFTDLSLGEASVLYKKWIDDGYFGDMTYLKNHLAIKESPELLLKNAKSAIVVIKNYKNTNVRKLDSVLKIARYAVGLDYHSVIKEKLLKLSTYIKSENPNISNYCGVDSAPIAERSLALKAGIGFLGKNAMVIKPGLGSYFFIGIILTDSEFENDKPLSWNCGECRLCIDACPTKAIIQNGVVNATKCISYQTIEQKTPLSDTQIKNTNGWIFGCDICQEVCPYNHGNVPLTNWIEFLPSAGVGFNFFNESTKDAQIPKTTPLYRSRKRLSLNWKNFKETLK